MKIMQVFSPTTSQQVKNAQNVGAYPDDNVHRLLNGGIWHGNIFPPHTLKTRHDAFENEHKLGHNLKQKCEHGVFPGQGYFGERIAMMLSER